MSEKYDFKKLIEEQPATVANFLELVSNEHHLPSVVCNKMTELCQLARVKTLDEELIEFAKLVLSSFNTYRGNAYCLIPNGMSVSGFRQKVIDLRAKAGVGPNMNDPRNEFSSDV